jgi:ADP-ribose diphosphatase
MRPWKTLERRTLLSRKPWLEVGDEKIELPDGRIIDGYPWVRSRDYSVVTAVRDDGRITVLRSYRHGTRNEQLELPAGVIEPGESPLDAAKRELREETGYEADDWTSLGSHAVHANYGVGTQHSFIARGLRKVAEPHSGDLEETTLDFVPLAEALAALDRGEIGILSSAAALAFAALRLR